MISNPRPQIPVLTGSIGSGKSTVAKQLTALGATVISADELARKVVAPGSQALDEIRSTFGTDFITPDGLLDRARMAELIFSCPKSKQKLEAITHPRIQALASQELQQALDLNELANKDSPAPVVYDCPLYFESLRNSQRPNSMVYGPVIVVSANEKNCLNRIMARDKITIEQAKRRLAAQIPIAEKVAAADLVIENDGSLIQLNKQVEQLYQDLIRWRFNSSVSN